MTKEQERMLEVFITKALEHYKSKGKALPKSVTEYCDDFPKGCGRTALRENTGLTCSAFLKIINTEYIPPTKSIDKLYEEIEKKQLILLSDINPSLFKRSDKIKVQCKRCSRVNITTLESLRGSVFGCKSCGNNLQWSEREEELKNIISSRLDGELISSIPNNQTGYISIRCNKCCSEYTTQLVGVVSPNTELRATCPNCRSSDRRVTYKGKTFSSGFERDCYLLLEPWNPETHVLYKEYFDTTRRISCDFKISNIFIEVSNFKTDYKDYFSNIEYKRSLVGSDPNYSFFFLTSLDEVKDFINHNLKDIVRPI